MSYLPEPSFGVLLSHSAIIQLYQDYLTCWERNFREGKNNNKKTDWWNLLSWVGVQTPINFVKKEDFYEQFTTKYYPHLLHIKPKGHKSGMTKVKNLNIKTDRYMIHLTLDYFPGWTSVVSRILNRRQKNQTGV